MTQSLSQARTTNYLRQVKGSVVFKGLAVLASFLAIPLMIRYLGQEQYGVWSTLLSIMSWVVFFDLGVGNGLRNKLAEALAKNQTSEAIGYVSSGYSLIGALSLLVFAVTACVVFFIPWQRVFNTQALSTELLRNAVLTAAFFVLLNFWLGLINQLLSAVQKVSVTVFGQLISNATALLLVFVLHQTTSASLLYLVIAYGASIMLANLTLSLWFFSKHQELRPRLSLNRKHIQPLLSVGLQFFIVQIAVLVIFTTDKILITQLFGPTYVTQYDVVFKLFSVITVLHGLATAPLWSSYTDAYHRNDFHWISTTIRAQLKLFMLIVLATAILGITAPYIIQLWVGEEIIVPNMLIFSMFLFIIVSTWSNVFAYALNGIGEIKIQVITASIAMLINIPLSIILVKIFGFGVHGVLLATCLSLSIFAVAGPVKVRSILANHSAIK
jgi:O-antigen/teichoic acid export membrane protein